MNIKSRREDQDEIMKFEEYLLSQDFSKYSDKKFILNKILKNVNQYKEGVGIMENSNRKFLIRVASITAICIISVFIMQTASAQEFAAKIIKTVSLGHISAIQVEPSADSSAVPELLKGKIFDKDGKPIEVFTKNSSQKLYTADGEEIAAISEDRVMTAVQREAERKEITLEVKNPKEISKYTCFKVLLPSYLPEGFKFDRAEVYKDNYEVEVVNSKYVDLIFINEKNNEKMYMQQRFADGTTSYQISVDSDLEAVKVNGADGIIFEGMIQWEANNTIYMISSKGKAMDNKELLKIAESVK